ncbi:MAG TPA: HD-GYP domain-containing protein [Solirubrobacteraceae bacterium]|jgi:HD-GYP domain-containing protein (c-di-GMP phosphodiesterase class II)|nr:HD-GYP domain-containing protein [Solirubrobacteraceae bacterium]
MNRAAEREQAPAVGLAFNSSAGLERLASQFRPRLGQPMPAREWRAESTVALTFMFAAVPLAVWLPGHGSHSPWVALLFVALFALTSRIEFDVSTGYGPPTTLVLIPMLYALPPGWVPLLVAMAFVVGNSPSMFAGRRASDCVASALANSFHSLGPALVFSLAGPHGPTWSGAYVPGIALAAQLGCDFVASIAREWLREGTYPRLSMRLMAGVYLMDVCLTPIAFAVAFAAQGRPLAVLITLPLGGLLMFFARDRQARMQTMVELSAAYRGTAFLLGDVVEADDAYTASHSRDVVDLCKAVGPMLGLNEDQLRRLELAALLHDVGKIAIPKSIINKPGKLTPDERSIIETHTVEGEKMLRNVGGLLGEVGTIVRSCHERYDGAGYPDGLAGEAIAVEARIVACCDAFNAMTTDRPYRAALSLEVALGELSANRGTQFDPRVVDCLVTLHRP